MAEKKSPFRRVLITGCAGFLGSHLVDRFLDAGVQVRGIDNLLTGSTRNLEGALDRGFAFNERDIIDPWDEEPADLVMNLACAASPPRYQADPIHTLRTSVIGTLNAASFASEHGARLVHTSTSEVYGDPEVHPQVEEYRGAVNMIGPRACYDEGKRAAETVLFDFHREKDLSIGVVRIFNTYGPRMDPFDGRVVSNFIRQALLGEPLTIYGKGEQTRSFCYADDMVEGIWKLAHSDATGPINIGNPVELTIMELAETIRELIGSKVEFIFRPLPMDDPQRRKPNISKAAVELGWEPSVPLAEGLRKTVDYFDDLISSGQLANYTTVEQKFLSVAE